jgi:hypothetical protein
MHIDPPTIAAATAFVTAVGTATAQIITALRTPRDPPKPRRKSRSEQGSDG